VYGAFAYGTPWRLVVSLWIPAFALLILIMLYLYYRVPHKPVGRFAVWMVFVAGVVFQTGFTLFECVYSHVLKNALYFVGVSRDALLQLFPTPAYHLPDNLWFEITGAAQVAGLWAAWSAWRVFSERARAV
jgi:hypothetical protein